MFSAGFGAIDHTMLEKDPGELGMLVVKIGGPAYRIGMGGGAASSVPSGASSPIRVELHPVLASELESGGTVVMWV